MSNLDKLNRLLEESATVSVKDEEFILKRPNGAALQTLYTKQSKGELTEFDFVCKCIELCMPDLEEGMGMSLLTLDGGLPNQSDFKNKVFEFCGMDPNLLNAAFEDGKDSQDFLSQEDSE